MPERILSFVEALDSVLAHARSFGSPAKQESAELPVSAGRVLAEPLRAERDQPPFARSTRDGYAVRSSDAAAGAQLRLLGSVRAGEQWTGAAVGPGEALEIMTGAPLPEGADAVLMLEYASPLQEGTLDIVVGRTLRTGENVVPRAAEARAGADVVPMGRRLGPTEIALAASCGYAEVQVFARPRVAIVATGDELVELDATPEPWQIRNSNTRALAALVAGEGGEPVALAIAPDTAEDVRARIAAASGAELLLLSGGVSMGKYDLVEAGLAEAGAEFLFTGALIQPGKPIVFGRLPKGRAQGPGDREQGSTPPGGANAWQYFFGLPGNPVSTEVCFRLFVAPLLQALGGATELPPRFVEARLAEDVAGGVRVTRFLPAVLTGDWQRAEVRLVPWQGSGDLAANARANCFAVLPAETARFRAGETVRVLLR